MKSTASMTLEQRRPRAILACFWLATAKRLTPAALSTRPCASMNACSARTTRRTLADVAELASVTPDAEPLWNAPRNRPTRPSPRDPWLNLAESMRSADDRAGAAAFYRRALAKEKDSAAIALDLNALAKVVDPPEAVPLLERALAIDRRVLGAMHAETATTEANLAGLLADSPKNAEAIRLAFGSAERVPANRGAGPPPYRGGREHPGLCVRGEGRPETGRANVPHGARDRSADLRTPAPADAQRCAGAGRISEIAALTGTSGSAGA